MPRDEKKIWKWIFLVYLLILIKLIVYKYPLEELVKITQNWKKDVILEGLATANFIPGKSIRMYIRYFYKFPFWNGFSNLIGNILVFIPYGILLPVAYMECAKWWKTLLWAVGFVITIEMYQLFSAFGALDVDDILLNVAGAMIGYGIYHVLKKKKDICR